MKHHKGKRYHIVEVADKSAADEAAMKLRAMGYLCSEGVRTAATEWVVQVTTDNPIGREGRRKLEEITGKNVQINFESPCNPW